MEKNDIGIFTFWDVPNYGTFAQAYALQRVLQKLYPDRDVRQIAYLDSKHYRFYYSKLPLIKPWHKKFYKDIIARNTVEAFRKRELFFQAYESIPHTKKFTKEELKKARFNTIIVGSDIVWDYSFRCFNHDEFLFGRSFNSDSICAYAASFGTVRPECHHPEYVLSGIRNMKKISVRDENSQRIVEQITGRSPEIVLDPTWLWDFTEDKNVVSPKFKDYMVVYGQDFTEDFITQIIEYAKKRGLKLVCLDCNNDNYTWCDVVLRQHELTPYEWIGLFREAKTIATTTFHGLTFSLIFNKQFAFCKTDFILAKAGTFLKDLGLYRKFTDSNISVKEMIDEDWDYKYINTVIDAHRTKSIQFLKSIIPQRQCENKSE